MNDTEKTTLERRIDELCVEVERLQQYAHALEHANLDVTARLQDYIGQYDPTEAFVLEVKAENAKLRSAAAKAWRLFVDYGATHPCDLPRVDAVRNELLDLGIEVGQ